MFSDIAQFVFIAFLFGMTIGVVAGAVLQHAVTKG